MIDAGAIGKVGAEDDLRGRNQPGERADGDGVGDLRGVVIEAAELRIDRLARELALVRRPAHDLDLEAFRNRGERAAAVGEDPVDVLVALRGAAEQQVRDGAGGVGGPFD